MRALIIVDVQNDFLPGGALGIPGGDLIIPIINALIPRFPLVIATQDWHPPEHQSFAANHTGKKVGDVIAVHGIEQVLWPVHCVRFTKGAQLAPSLDKSHIESCFYKGTDPWIDSYSAFFDNARQKSTGLHDHLQSNKVDEVVIVGLATDYCVLYSAIDAIDLGYRTVVIEDACCGINLSPDDVSDALATMKEKGVKIFKSEEWNDQLDA